MDSFEAIPTHFICLEPIQNVFFFKLEEKKLEKIYIDNNKVLFVFKSGEIFWLHTSTQNVHIGG